MKKNDKHERKESKRTEKTEHEKAKEQVKGFEKRRAEYKKGKCK